MNYLHKELEVGPQEVVEVSLDGHANVMLMERRTSIATARVKPIDITVAWPSVRLRNSTPPIRDAGTSWWTWKGLRATSAPASASWKARARRGGSDVAQG